VICLSVLNSLIYLVKQRAKAYSSTLHSPEQLRSELLYFGNLNDQVFSLFFNNDKFEFFHGHWRFTWLLTLVSIKLVEMRVNKSKYPH